MLNLNLTMFVVGCLLALMVPYSLTGILVAWGLIAGVYVFNYIRTQRRLILLSGPILCLAIGLSVTSTRFQMFRATTIESPRVQTIAGCIDGAITKRNGSHRFVFVPLQESKFEIKRRYRVSWFKPESQVTAGSCWRLMLRLKPPRGAVNETGFDYERWLFSKKIVGLATVKSDELNQQIIDRAHTGALLAVRMSIHRNLQKRLTQYNSRGLVSALAVGVRNDLSTADWNVLKRTGTAHLMAISGLHVGLAATFGFFLGRFLPQPGIQARNLADRGAVCGLLCAGAYAALAGFSVSTVRALIMLVLWFGFRALRLRINSHTVLMLALALLLVMNPFAAAGVSLWLSAGAVAAIIFAAQGGTNTTGVMAKAGMAIRIQGMLLILLFPLSIVVSGGVSWLAMPVNLILIPLFSVLVVPLVLFALLLRVFFSAASDLVFVLLAAVLDKIWLCLTLLADLPVAFSNLAASSMWFTVPVVLVALVWFFPIQRAARGLSLLFILPMFFARFDRPNVGDYQLDVLDVGQALSVIVQTHSHVLVYDTGNAWPGGDSAIQLLVPLLYKRGVKKIDTLVVSHADRDHAGGALSLQNHFAIDSVWVGEDVSGLREARYCHQGVSFDIDQVNFQFLHPQFTQQYSGNDQSCVLLISSGSSRTLLTGDLGGALERRILKSLTGQSQTHYQAKASARIDLFVGGHHGSLSSSDHYFAAQVRARFAVFSNGYANQWGMPRDEVIQRWRAMNTQVLETANHGQIQFSHSSQDGLQLTGTARTRYSGVWRWHAPQLD